MKTSIKKQLEPGSWNRITRSPMVYLAIFVLVMLIYGQALQFFVGKLDDDLLIIKPLNFLKNLANVKTAFSRDPYLNATGSFYRPLQTITYMVDAQFFFERGSVFYFTNILLHTATCFTLFYLLSMPGGNRKAAFIFTLVFLASPLFVQAVAWAPSRGDLLSGLCGLLTLVFFIKMVNRRSYRYGVFAIISFAAAMFSKETSIFIPVMIFLYYILCEKNRKVPITAITGVFTGFLLVMILFYFLRMQVVKSSIPGSEFGIVPFFHNLRAFPEFIGKFFIPVNLSPMPGYTLLNTILGLLMIALLVGCFIRFRSGSFPLVVFGLAWFIIFTIPGVMYSHTFGSAAYDYLEHRAYLPMAGIIISMFATFTGIPEGKTKNRVTNGLLGLITILGIYSFIYTGHYKSPLEFYDRAISSNPNSAVAFYNRGCFMAEMEDHPGAISDYNSALHIKPDYSRAYLNKGVSLYMLHDKAGAILQYDQAIKYEPGLFQAHFNKATTSYELGLTDDALMEYNSAIEIYPDYAPCYTARGIIYFERQKFPEAMHDFSTAIKYDVNDAVAYINRGKIKYKEDDLKAACADWTIAANLNNSEARELLNKFCNR